MLTWEEQVREEDQWGEPYEDGDEWEEAVSMGHVVSEKDVE